MVPELASVFALQREQTRNVVHVGDSTHRIALLLEERREVCELNCDESSERRYAQFDHVLAEIDRGVECAH